MRDVADVAVEERDPARGIQRFEDDPAAGTDLVKGELEELKEVAGLQVLDDLRCEEAAERRIGSRRQVADGIGFRDVESSAAASSAIS